MTTSANAAPDDGGRTFLDLPREDRRMLCHDPRLSNDRSHSIETNNPALMLAETIRREIGREIDWERVADEADACDWPVVMRGGSHHDQRL